jgi:hypothetical protein
VKRSAFPTTAIGLWVLSSATTAPAQAPEVASAQLYELTTELGMPHLEENLRYTLRHTRECLTDRMLTTVFPILEHPALSGCSLRDELRDGTTVSYKLICDGGHGTKGEATWRFERPAIRGVLHITLGGKNMTVYQKVTAIPLVSCRL